MIGNKNFLAIYSERVSQGQYEWSLKVCGMTKHLGLLVLGQVEYAGCTLSIPLNAIIRPTHNAWSIHLKALKVCGRRQIGQENQNSKDDQDSGEPPSPRYVLQYLLAWIQEILKVLMGAPGEPSSSASRRERDLLALERRGRRGSPLLLYLSCVIASPQPRQCQ